MASDLLSIARTGAQAARAGLDVTGQNIANAATEGYVRRSVQLAEVASSGSLGRPGSIALSGVRVDRIVRNADTFLQAEVRRTGADAARAEAEVAGLMNVESAVEQSGMHAALVDFEAALQRLAANPADRSLRAATMASVSAMAGTLNLASASLDAAANGLKFEAGDSVTQINLLADELARVNQRLSRLAVTGGDQTTLLDQRDLLLKRLSTTTDIATTLEADGTAEVRLGGTSGPLLVNGGAVATLGAMAAADGTIDFTSGGTTVIPATGSLTTSNPATALNRVSDFNRITGDLAAINDTHLRLNDTIDQLNTRLDTLAGQLAANAEELATAVPGSPGETALIQARDAYTAQRDAVTVQRDVKVQQRTDLIARRGTTLEDLGGFAGISVEIVSPGQTADVRLGGPSGPYVVQGTASTAIALASTDGRTRYTVGGEPVMLNGGAMTGKAQALATLATTRQSLDAIAKAVIDTTNAQQVQGIALDGSAGKPMFTGTSAATIGMAFTDGALIAAAPASSGNSLNPGNLTALRAALAAVDPAGKADKLLFDISSAVAARAVTRDTLRSFASNADLALQAQAGVNLDQEAVNLLRFQQAFQASGRVMQVASDIFDTILGIR